MRGAILHHAASDLPAHIANLAFKITHTSLTRVGTNDLPDCVVLKDNLLIRKSRSLALLLDQILLGNLELLELGVAMQPQNLHAVLQGTGDRMQHIRRRDKSTCERSYSTSR